jgi:hypothetical protein
LYQLSTRRIPRIKGNTAGPTIAAIYLFDSSAVDAGHAQEVHLSVGDGMVEATAVTCGVIVLVVVWMSAFRTILIPRRSSSRMARWTVRACAAAAFAAAHRLPVRARGAMLEFNTAAAMFLMVLGWLAGLALGFALVAVPLGHVALDPDMLIRFFTLDTSGTAGALGLAFAASALLILSMFASYLIQFMAAYHRRERMITRWSGQVQVVTDAERLLADHLRAGSQDSLDRFFAEWADWLADIHDSHTSYPGLMYQRRTGDLCWAKTALIAMDAAALVESIAPRWAPVHATVLLDVGSDCVQDLARRMGIVLPVMKVSLHGREERTFTESARFATHAGLASERDIGQARRKFQEIRIRYAPYAVLIASRLSSPALNGEHGSGSPEPRDNVRSNHLGT